MSIDSSLLYQHFFYKFALHVYECVHVFQQHWFMHTLLSLETYFLHIYLYCFIFVLKWWRVTEIFTLLRIFFPMETYLPDVYLHSFIFVHNWPRVSDIFLLCCGFCAFLAVKITGQTAKKQITELFISFFLFRVYKQNI